MKRHMVKLDAELAALFDRMAASEEPPVSRDDMVCAALTDWAIGHGYVYSNQLEEDSETLGNA